MGKSIGKPTGYSFFKNSENSENVIGIFYIDRKLEGWNCIDWDESKIISLYDFIVEAKKMKISESEELFV